MACLNHATNSFSSSVCSRCTDKVLTSGDTLYALDFTAQAQEISSNKLLHQVSTVLQRVSLVCGKFPASIVMQIFTDGTHRASEYDWLVGYPDVFGACFFWPGVWLLVVENANTDIDMRRHNWEASGRKGRRPGYANRPSRS